jgi:hypothetical protein
MGLILSKGADKTLTDSETNEQYIVPGKAIHIHGTDIEMLTVYARIEFTAHPDGTTMSVSFKTYKDHSFFDLNDELYTDIVSKGFDFGILETEEQSLAVALQYSIVKFDELGYSAIIE